MTEVINNISDFEKYLKKKNTKNVIYYIFSKPETLIFYADIQYYNILTVGCRHYVQLTRI